MTLVGHEQCVSCTKFRNLDHSFSLSVIRLGCMLLLLLLLICGGAMLFLQAYIMIIPDTTPVDSEDNEDSSELEQAGWTRQSPSHSKSQELPQEADEEEEAEDPLSLSDSDLMCGLLEVMAVMWEVVKDTLEKPAHRKVKKNLVTKMEQNLPVLFNTFTVSVKL